jgi:hypothetical protein
MATPTSIVQLVWRSDDAEYDVWYDICPARLPTDKAVIFARIVAAMDRVGTHTDTHVLCWPSEEHELTSAELKEIQTFDYEAHALPADHAKSSPVLISHRFMIIA